jgi:hypothetical protein
VLLSMLGRRSASGAVVSSLMAVACGLAIGAADEQWRRLAPGA